MKRITGRNLKPIIIILCCCLCVTITNCDNKLHAKRSITSTNIERRPPRSLESKSSEQTSEISPPKNRLNQSQNLSHDKAKAEDTSIAKVNLTSNNGSSEPDHSKVNTPGTTIDTTSTITKRPGISTNIQPPINTGALLRGASVFLVLSVVVIVYIIFRCARLNKNRTQMVRKYGVLAHRQDVEMRPLPLDDEDEDDTTVFDASEVAAIHDKHRRST